ncbi:hypothetical protein ACVWYH_004955 [Bradyrhizobium sp. GM24.11]
MFWRDATAPGAGLIAVPSASATKPKPSPVTLEVLVLRCTAGRASKGEGPAASGPSILRGLRWLRHLRMTELRLRVS